MGKLILTGLASTGKKRHTFSLAVESRYPMLTAEQIITELNRHANAEAVEGMARFGIRSVHALGISLPTLRKAEAISKMDSKTAQWVAKDALRELNAKSPTT